MTVVKVVYPLIESKTGIKSNYYTMTAYDTYTYNKIKYIRGNPEFYTNDLRKRNSCYKLLEFRPKTIEESEGIKDWKCEYNPRSKRPSANDYIASYASYKMLTGK